ncbi:AAA family ATPase [Proteus mirabilis]|uniref:AAA family ATPase n=1 Tax=Proteus mirabilis TaxID=584 RepID=UPI0018C59A98|nr:AAA family ATPase [Proteus mirabilis]EKU3801711.1 AAA family ATPase [Proteus mirabilis]ELD1833115.1 AAA family ATPase [Proteus mirabilis]MBG2791917.1 AAA family ATPase [Proteus mirabilis]MBG2823874.1 AAA family ATPase [Proteus mirabilis]MDM3818139.1 AAA family ATPase [Proteus mirabilis]
MMLHKKLHSEMSWEQLGEYYNEISDMSGVRQDPIHHAEGDVAIHTQQVIHAIKSLPEYQELSEREQQILWIAALLHDVEKRSTTREENGRIISPGHARKGELTTRRFLYEKVPVSFIDREQIAALVRYHGLPLWLMDKPDPKKALLAASLRVDCYLLALLAKADVLGRSCEDKPALLDKIALFTLYCEELNCWRTPARFISDGVRFHYFHSENNVDPHYEPYPEQGSEVIVLCGLPGMGKDSYIRQYCADMPVVSLDALRQQHNIKPDDRDANGWIAQLAKEQARIYLREHKPFVWNATNITKQMRNQLIALFYRYQAKVTLVYIEVPYLQWKKQNSARKEAVPDKVMERMLSKLEVPTPEEALNVIYWVDGEAQNLI